MGAVCMGPNYEGQRNETAQKVRSKKDVTKKVFNVAPLGLAE
jgi:hypothetical protein